MAIKHKKKNGFLAVLFLAAAALIVSSCASNGACIRSQPDWARPSFAEVETIRIADPMLAFVGLAEEGKGVLNISLVDVAKYSGHVCAGVASGYIITRESLKKLYPDEMPVRGQIKVTASAPNDLFGCRFVHHRRSRSLRARRDKQGRPESGRFSGARRQVYHRVRKKRQR